MKLSSLKYIAVALMLGGTMTSCSDFLDRPNEDSYNDGNYYQNDTQTKMSVVSLYTSIYNEYLDFNGLKKKDEELNLDSFF